MDERCIAKEAVDVTDAGPYVCNVTQLNIGVSTSIFLGVIGEELH